MAERHFVYRLTQEAYDQLRLAAEENPETYLDPDLDFAEILRTRGVSRQTEETPITTDRPIHLTMDGTSGLRNRARHPSAGFLQVIQWHEPELGHGRAAVGMDDPLSPPCIQPRAVATSLECQHARLH